MVAALVLAGGIIMASQVGAPPGQRGGPQMKVMRRGREAARLLKSSGLARATWVRSYTRDGTSTETGQGVLYGFRMAGASDGGLFMLGHTSIDIPAVYDSCLFKVDASGVVVWQKVLTIPTLTQFLLSVSPTSDGGCIAGGKGGSGVLAMKFDAGGNITWQRSFGRQGTRDEFADLRQTSDGGYVLLARSDRTGGSGEVRDYDFLLIKLDHSGHPVWQRTYATPLNEWSAAVVELGDGGLAVCGGAPSLDLFERGSLVVLRLTASGDIVWQTSYQGWVAGLFSFEAAPDGGLLAAGRIDEDGPSSRSDAWAMKIAAGGALEWNKVFHGEHDDGLDSIAAMPDGNILACGDIDEFASLSNPAALLMKLSPDGQVIWQKAYGGGETLNGSAGGRSALAAMDGSLYLAGTTSFGGMGGVRFLLVKASPDGQVERLPGFVMDAALEVIDMPLETRPADLVAQDVPILTSDPGPTVLDVPIRGGLLFAPPLDVAGVTVSSRSLALVGRSNVLTWEANPANSDLGIVKWRIHSSGPISLDDWGWGDSTERLDEVDGDVFRFAHSPILAGGYYSYMIWGVGADGGEGLPVLFTQPSAGRRP
ncbi:MAG: hypothetical protein MUE80_03965 [Acidobacteria bacterium]|nr:hypothetical protein [Acidobacteriota bacterium]